LATLDPLGMTTHPEMVSATAIPPATERNKRRLRGVLMKGISPENVTPVLRSSFR
jgi:hypothetical protein